MDYEKIGLTKRYWHCSDWRCSTIMAAHAHGKGTTGMHLDRLHAKGYISDPKNKAKSVVVTEEGVKRSQELFEKCFATSR